MLNRIVIQNTTNKSVQRKEKKLTISLENTELHTINNEFP